MKKMKWLMTGIACLWATQAWALGVPLQSAAQQEALGPYMTNWTTNALLTSSAQTLNAPMEFASFDNTLGQLVGVHIEVSGSFTATLRVVTLGGPATLNQGHVEVDVLIDLFNDGSAETQLAMSEAVPAASLPTPAMQDIHLEGTLSESLFIDSGLEAFTTDAGASFSIGCASTSMHYGNVTPGDGSALLTHQASSGCSAQVVFEYLADQGGNNPGYDPVPLPGTLLLMASGLLGLRRLRY